MAHMAHLHSIKTLSGKRIQSFHKHTFLHHIINIAGRKSICSGVEDCIFP